MVRTPKEWTETCRQCGGSGGVHKRERFSLYTPEECARWNLEVRKLDGVPQDAYVCEAAAGASIFEACREGVSLAEQLRRTVVFEFNEAAAICKPGDDPDSVAKEWWVRAYGKTYEQSMKDR